MITTQKIMQLVSAGSYRSLICRIVHNGRANDERTIEHLCDQSGLAACGLGLAVQRTCELGLGPVREAFDLVQRLLALQKPSGLFGLPGSPASMAASAVAARALIDWLNEVIGSGWKPQPEISSSANRALDAIARSMGTASIDDRRVIAWQLGDQREFRALQDRLARQTPTAAGMPALPMLEESTFASAA